MVLRIRQYQCLILSLANGRLEKFKASVVALRTEELVDERVEDLVVKFIIDLASENGLGDEGSQGIPRDLVRIDILPVLAHTVKPLINAV